MLSPIRTWATAEGREIGGLKDAELNCLCKKLLLKTVKLQSNSFEQELLYLELMHDSFHRVQFPKGLRFHFLAWLVYLCRVS